jgi:hypothetical protein
MNATETAIPVVFYPSVEDRPDVLEAAKSATAYFESLYRDGPTAGSPHPIKLRWTLLPEGPLGEIVQATLTEQYEGQPKGIGYEFPLKHLLDQDASEAMMLRLWRRVLVARSNVIGKRMFEALAELSRQEEERGE